MPKAATLPPMTFSARTETLLDHVDALCVRRGVRLTASRRQVMGLLLDSEKPLGAYELLEQLQARHAGAAPPTVYRALDFLLEHGLVHKIERLASFVPCVHALDGTSESLSIPDGMGEHTHDCGHAHHTGDALALDHDHAHCDDGACVHATQFLICRQCSRVTELEDPDIVRAILAISRRTGFRTQHTTVEIEGLCAECAAAQNDAQPESAVASR